MPGGPDSLTCLLDPASALLWGGLRRLPGGRGGRLILLGVIAFVAALSGGWAHMRAERNAGEPVARKHCTAVGGGCPPSSEAFHTFEEILR